MNKIILIFHIIHKFIILSIILYYFKLPLTTLYSLLSLYHPPRGCVVQWLTFGGATDLWKSDGPLEEWWTFGRVTDIWKSDGPRIRRTGSILLLNSCHLAQKLVLNHWWSGMVWDPRSVTSIECNKVTWVLKKVLCSELWNLQFSRSCKKSFVCLTFGLYYCIV